MAATARALDQGLGANEQIANTAGLTRQIFTLFFPAGSYCAHRLVQHDPRQTQDFVLNDAGADITAAEEHELDCSSQIANR